MYSEMNFDEIAETMELDNDIELKHQWKHFYDTLHVFGLKICKDCTDCILDKIRAEIIQSIQNGILKIESGNEELFRILDEYKAEVEPQEREVSE